MKGLLGSRIEAFYFFASFAIILGSTTILMGNK